MSKQCTKLLSFYDFMSFANETMKNHNALFNADCSFVSSEEVAVERMINALNLFVVVIKLSKVVQALIIIATSCVWRWIEKKSN